MLVEDGALGDADDPIVVEGAVTPVGTPQERV